jgi:hypothetical protein
VSEYISRDNSHEEVAYQLVMVDVWNQTCKAVNRTEKNYNANFVEYIKMENKVIIIRPKVNQITAIESSCVNIKKHLKP